MKKLYSFLLLFVIAFTGKISAQVTPFCNPSGNVIIYSCYDGGILNINIDQNIPNIKIGVVTYEAVQIQISGAFAANVTEVRYAGYNANNNNCGLGVSNTTITGAVNSTNTILLYPPATLSNPNGYSSIICNYSCSSTTNQGGCNTPDQVVDYFMNNFSGTNTFYYHFTQYNCYQNANTYNVSTGGNCCIAPVGLGIASNKTNSANHFFPNPATSELTIKFDNKNTEHKIELRNLLGEKIKTLSFPADAEQGKINLETVPKGIYFAVLSEDGVTKTEKILIQ